MSAKRKARGNISKNSKQIKVRRSENGTKYRKTKMIKAPRMWTHYGGLNHQTLLSIESSNSLRTESAVRMSFLSKQWEDVLKYLEIIHCTGAREIVVNAMYLESFKFVSGSDQSCRMRLEDILGAKHQRNFVLCGCQDHVEAVVSTWDEMCFTFSGFVKSISSIKLASAGSLEQFSALRDYLERFDCPEDISLYVGDAKV
ncbi:hypothetical protein ACFX15_044954 [Malus domestica]